MKYKVGDYLAYAGPGRIYVIEDLNPAMRLYKVRSIEKPTWASGWTGEHRIDTCCWLATDLDFALAGYTTDEIHQALSRKA